MRKFKILSFGTLLALLLALVPALAVQCMDGEYLVELE